MRHDLHPLVAHAKCVNHHVIRTRKDTRTENIEPRHGKTTRNFAKKPLPIPSHHNHLSMPFLRLIHPLHQGHQGIRT